MTPEPARELSGAEPSHETGPRTTVANTLRPLTQVVEIDRVLAQSSSRPILIFKHSSTCGVSAQAYEEVQALLAGPPLPADVYLVDVWADRPVSNAIAERLRTRHESPQVLLVDHGRVRWSVSHFGLTAHALRAALTGLARTE